VLHYEARIDPDLPGKTLRGRVRISLVAGAAGLREARFDAGELQADSVRVQGRRVRSEKIGQQLVVDLPAPLAAGARQDIEIYYHGAPRYGLEFHPERGELYTIFSTSQWMVCVDAPHQRATLDLSVALPGGLKAAGTGRLVSKLPLDAGRELWRWRQNVAIPSFVFGFAAGPYAEAKRRAGKVSLRYLSVQRTPEELVRIFGETAGMLSFFGNRAGVPYRGAYSQVLVAKTIGQEAAGLALLSEAYGQRVLGEPRAQGLIAHELAHQWWGVMVTNHDWNHFWLNEGLAVFMTAAYMQHRFGEDEYAKLVAAWRLRIDQLHERKTDHALVYEEWTAPTADDRAVVYQKSAYVLHLLRQELGEAAFWRGVRGYTQAHWGKSVKSEDFQRAMERGAGRDLSAFFAQWVFGTGPSTEPR
jgi:aminopeptidase N